MSDRVTMSPARAKQAILAGTAPKNLTVTGNLDLSGCTGLTALPDGLSVSGWLYLSGCTGLTALPDGLSVSGGLDLSGCTGLTALPDGLSVSEGLKFKAPAPYLANAPAGLRLVPDADDRGYWEEVLGVRITGCYEDARKQLRRSRKKFLSLELEPWQRRALGLYLANGKAIVDHEEEAP
jgi:hypothetical protein